MLRTLYCRIIIGIKASGIDTRIRITHHNRIS